MRVSVLLLLGTLALAGCDASGPTDPSASPTATAGSSSSAVPASPSPRPTDAFELYDAGRGALIDSGGWHVTGTLDIYAVDVTYGPDDIGTGTVTSMDGGALELRRLADGVVYARGDAAWFAHPGTGSPDLSALAGRWVTVPATDPPTSLAFADLASGLGLVRGFLADAGLGASDVDGDVTGPEPFEGTAAYVIHQSGNTYAFAADGPPRPLGFDTVSGGRRQHLRFDRYGVAPQVAAPTDATTVPPSS